MLSLFNHTTITIALGSAVLGAISGALGSFAVLRRQSLIGDAISHAALPGIVLAFVITGSKSALVLMSGAAIAGLCGMLVVMLVTSTSRVKFDSALGLVLSVFFGFGLVLLTWIQKKPSAAQAGLDRFLFGQAAGLLTRDVWVLAITTVFAFALLALFWKEFKLLAFDRDYGLSLGLPLKKLDVVLTGLIVVAIVLGLQTVGVVLMSAMIVAPGAAARQWTNRLGKMVALAGLFGAISGIIGAVVSSSVEKLPTGPTIVLAVGAFVLFSLLAAPRRGLIAETLRRRHNRRKLRLNAVLTDLFELESQHALETPHGHTAQAIQAMSFGQGPVQHNLEELEQRGLVARMGSQRWTLTPRGRDRVERLVARLGHHEDEA